MDRLPRWAQPRDVRLELRLRGFTPVFLDAWVERAAILQYVAVMTVESAEWMAADLVESQMRRTPATEPHRRR